MATPKLGMTRSARRVACGATVAVLATTTLVWASSEPPATLRGERRDAAATTVAASPTTRAISLATATTQHLVTVASTTPAAQAPTTTNAPLPSGGLAGGIVAQATPTTTLARFIPVSGSFCGGWIHRAPAPAKLLIADSTGGRIPTAADCAAAHAFYNQTAAAIAKYADINVAIAANFKPGKDAPGQPGRHYVKWGPTPLLDPNAPQGLVYRFDASGNATLLAAYFYEANGPLPQPGGQLTTWHAHSAGAMWMLHVWVFPGAVDPFALMLSSAIG